MRIAYNTEERKCTRCDKTFQGTKRAKYCSASCSVLASRDRNPKESPKVIIEKLRAELETLKAKNGELQTELVAFRLVASILPAVPPHEPVSTLSPPPELMPKPKKLTKRERELERMINAIANQATTID